MHLGLQEWDWKHGASWTPYYGRTWSTGFFDQAYLWFHRGCQLMHQSRGRSGSSPHILSSENLGFEDAARLLAVGNVSTWSLAFDLPRGAFC